jgi:hypothetical protein
MAFEIDDPTRLIELELIKTLYWWKDGFWIFRWLSDTITGENPFV